MKRTITMVLAAAAPFALLLSACQSAPTDIGTEADAATTTGKSGAHMLTTAAPAIAYIDTTMTGSHNHATYYNAIKIMDDDGSHKLLAYTGPTMTAPSVPNNISPTGVPSWASTGSGTQSSPWRLTFTEYTGGSYATTWRVKTLDVYVNSSGAPVATNAQTVLSLNDGRYLKGSAWRPGYNEIALVSDKSINNVNGYGEVYITDLSGNLTRIYPATGSASADEQCFRPSWSSTGDTLAFGLRVANVNGGENRIVLIKRDGTFIGSYLSGEGLYAINGTDFSSRGIIAFSGKVATAYNTSGVPTAYGPVNIYTLDPATGTKTLQFAAIQPSFSPDGLQLAYAGDGGISKRTIGSSSYTTLATSPWLGRPSWR